MFKRLATLLLALIFSVAFIIPIGVYAQEENQEQEKVIRVGWHEAPYFITDQHGRRSGYSYEYLRNIPVWIAPSVTPTVFPFRAV